MLAIPSDVLRCGHALRHPLTDSSRIQSTVAPEGNRDPPTATKKGILSGRTGPPSGQLKSGTTCAHHPELRTLGI